MAVLMVLEELLWECLSLRAELTGTGLMRPQHEVSSCLVEAALGFPAVFVGATAQDNNCCLQSRFLELAGHVQLASPCC